MDQSLDGLFPISQATVDAAFERVYAPWIQQMGMTDFDVREGYCGLRLPQDPSLQFSSGAICGQAIMAAIDTAASIAACSEQQPTKGTVYQHTHFLRPALGEDLKIEARVLRRGKSTAYIECTATLIDSDRIAAHAVLEFAY